MLNITSDARNVGPNRSACDNKSTRGLLATDHVILNPGQVTWTIFTEHKRLNFAFNQPSNKASPRQLRHLDFISQYTTTIRHISDKDNIVADALSKIDEICLPPTIEYAAIANAQDSVRELTTLTQGRIYVWTKWAAAQGLPSPSKIINRKRCLHSK
ncbi:transposon Ty3-G Gag-Pol polyprotein [Trichonephila clavipes]|nr:transposon Ty3-G Gag-Pol polyprotein [Trichonephila clavipes]